MGAAGYTLRERAAKLTCRSEERFGSFEERGELGTLCVVHRLVKAGRLQQSGESVGKLDVVAGQLNGLLGSERPPRIGEPGHAALRAVFAQRLTLQADDRALAELDQQQFLGALAADQPQHIAHVALQGKALM